MRKEITWLRERGKTVQRWRDRREAQALPNYETGFLLHWLDDEVLRRRVGNLMVECGYGTEEEAFCCAVRMELCAEARKANRDYLMKAVFKSFCRRVQWHRLYLQSCRKFGPLLPPSTEREESLVPRNSPSTAL